MHFVAENQSQARCQYCRNKISIHGGSTSNMMRHVKTKHPTLSLSGPQESETETAATATATGTDTATTTAAATTSATSASTTATTTATIPKRQRQTSLGGFVRRPIQPLQQGKVDEALVKMLATDFQPFSIVEDRGFRAYTQALDPTYVLPSRSTLSTQMVPNLFEKVRADLRERIRSAPAICLTTDCWTSNTTTSYMSVTCHYIYNFKLEANLLDCFELQSNHTSENLAQELKRVAQELDISEKVAACVTDNASNIVRAVAKS